VPKVVVSPALTFSAFFVFYSLPALKMKQVLTAWAYKLSFLSFNFPSAVAKRFPI